MTDLNNLSTKELQHNVGCYRNLQYHRSVISEGTRKIAFRNMAHLTRAQQYVTGSAPIHSSEQIQRVQQRMLLDQGMEDNKPNMWLVERGTFYPIQVYLALLFAAVEFFNRHCQEYAGTRDSEFSDYLRNNADYITKLGAFRDFFLHPITGNIATELEFAQTTDGHNLAPFLQLELDGYLSRLREQLSVRVEEILGELPELQRLYCFSLFLGLNIERIGAYGDAGDAQRMTIQVEEWNKRMHRLTDSEKSWAPSPQQRRNGQAIAECMDALCPASPELAYTDLEGVQTPLPPEAVFPPRGLPLAEVYGSGRIGQRVQKSLAPILRVLHTSGILLNEAVTASGRLTHEQMREKSSHTTPEEFIRWHLEEVANNLQQVHELASPQRVAAALLTEPLELYERLVEEHSRTARPELDRLINEGVSGQLRPFRNSVFHVSRPEQDPSQVDPGRAEAQTPLGIFVTLQAELMAFFSTPQPTGAQGHS